MKGVAIALFACLASALSGCAPLGLVYSHTFEPLSTNFNETPVVSEHAAGDVRQFNFYVRVLWHGNAIGEIAKQHGFDEVYYADLETLRVLGIWTQQWAHVYGSRKAEPQASGSP